MISPWDIIGWFLVVIFGLKFILIVIREILNVTIKKKKERLKKLKKDINK